MDHIFHIDLGPSNPGWILDDYMKGVCVDLNGDIIITGARTTVTGFKVDTSQILT